MAFGELADDEYQSDLGATRGNIGKGGVAGGGIRMAQVKFFYVLYVSCGQQRKYYQRRRGRRWY